MCGTHEVAGPLIYIFGLIVYQMRNRQKIAKKSSTFQKRGVLTKILSPTQILQWIQKRRNRLMRSAIIKKARQDDQQNQHQ